MDEHLPALSPDRDGPKPPRALRNPAWEEEWSNPDGDIPVSPEVRSSIPHPYRNYEIVAALAESSPSGLVDDTALPADLIAKRAARGDTTYTPPADPGQHRPLNVADFGVLVGIIGSWPAWVAVCITDHASLIQTAAWSALPISMTALGAARAHPLVLNRLIRKHNTYTRDEHAQLQRASADWPGRAHLSAFSNASQLQHEWDRRWPYAVHAGAAAAVWPEPHLVGLAHCIAADISAGKAWNSELFDVHRVRIDLPATLREIRLRAFRIWRIRADTLAPTAAADPDGSAMRRYREINDALTDAQDRLVAMIRELASYSAALKPIDALVDEIESLALSTQRVSDDAVRQLRIDAAGSEFTRVDICDARAELADLNANLTSQLGVLHAALRLPESALPLPTAS